MATAKQKSKVSRVMREHKEGKLASGSGKKVKSRKQAIAIAMSESGQSSNKAKRGTATRKKTTRAGTARKTAARKTTARKAAPRKKATSRSAMSRRKRTTTRRKRAS